MLNERTWHGNMVLNTLAVTSEQQLQGGIKVMHIVSLFIIPVTQMMIWELNTIRPDKMWSFWYEFKCSSKHEPWSLQTNAHRQNVFFLFKSINPADGNQHVGWTPTRKFLKSPGLCHVEGAWGEEVRTSGQLSVRSVRGMFIQQSVRELVVAWA